MDLVVRAFPILEGQEQSVREFARTLLAEKPAEAADFYRRFGVARETWHLQNTPGGLWLIGVTEIPDRSADEAGAAYAESTVQFDQWFKGRVRALSGIDPDTSGAS